MLSIKYFELLIKKIVIINIQSKKNVSKITICREMREEFDKYGLLITAAVAAPIRLVDQVH